MKGTQLIQQRIPFIDQEANKFIQHASGGVLKPLSSFGTRITILNVKDEIIEAFKKDFSKESEKASHDQTFSEMIEETWWEIIEFGARIILEWNGKKKQIEIKEPLLSIINAKDKTKGYNVYAKENLNVFIDNKVYKIKHLKFVVAPHSIEEEFREICVQRKRMKIGSISKGIVPHHKIQKCFNGYIILDHDLERLFEEKESPTHYGFVIRGRNGGAIAEVRELIRTHLEQFHQKLGLRANSSESIAHQDMLDALKELNEQAAQLGLSTDFSTGLRKKDVEITIKDFKLPNLSTTRIDIGDKVGPIIYQVANCTNKTQLIKVEITAEQGERIPVALFSKDIDLKGNATESLSIKFDVKSSQYANKEGLLIRAKVYRRILPPEPMHQVTRMLWLGMDPPKKQKDWLSISSYALSFPII